MKLSFGHPFKSITRFDEVDVPNLTVVTGPNGCGKTQLLQGIKQGAIVAGGMPTEAILYLDSAKFVVEPRFTDNLTKATAYDGNLTGFANKVKSLGPKWIESRKNFFGEQTDQIYKRLLEAGYFMEALDKESVQEIRSKNLFDQQTLNTLMEYSHSIRPMTLRSEPFFGALLHVAKLKQVPLPDITENDLRQHMDYVDLYFSNHLNTLSIDISRAFRTYHERRVRNEQRMWQVQVRGNIAVTYLTNSEFVAVYGRPPWEILNEIIQEARGLSYQFLPPNFDDMDLSYQAILVGDRLDRPLEVSELSSGEKTLLRLAVILYTSTMMVTDNLSSGMPRLLLLDEVDATLHPGMIGNFIRLLQRAFIEPTGVHVLLTTHSPTSVAIVAEGAIFKMDNKENGLSKVAKTWAIHQLCEGLVHVSEVKKFVFVEGNNDKLFYSATLDKLVKDQEELSSIRFVCPSNKEGAGGREEVKKVVRTMMQENLSNMFSGIIDWDGLNKPEAGILVTARWELENYLFDPMLVVATILARAVPLPKKAGRLYSLGRSDAYRLGSLQDEELQEIVNCISTEITNISHLSELQRSNIEYICAKRVVTLSIPTFWTLESGKRLQVLIQERFGAGQLNLNNLLNSYVHSDVFPSELRDLIQAIMDSGPEKSSGSDCI